MKNFYLPTKSAECWKSLLADPSKHWRDGYSAKSLAISWESAGGFPSEVNAAFQSSDSPVFRGLEFVAGFPEFKIQIPPVTRRPSQTDLMVVARSGRELVVVAVEGKVEESFGELVSDWRQKDTQGKQERLHFLTECLGLRSEQLDSIRYQLLHRTASALLAAETFAAARAVMLVHSFSQKRTGFKDYSEFLKLFGVQAAPGIVQSAATRRGINLYFAWVEGLLG
ncbi:MAG: hypothetical protein HY301_16675 [Verrucomicrobia bacterium]|nr:hypothetical protein [Verrucomicrobiota bacterium]